MNLRTSIRVCSLVLITGLQTGCGLKGDLYLPEQDAASEPAAETGVDMNKALEELPQDQPEENTQENPGPDQ